MEAWRKELYLAHHGILGQKWGVRNGPPYPLDAKDHSSSERRAGYKRSIDRTRMGGVDKQIKNEYDHSKSTKGRHIATRLGLMALSLATGNVKGMVIEGALIVNDIIGTGIASKKKHDADDRKEGLEIDKETGFAKKPKGSPEDPYDDVKKINPEFTNIDGNTKSNCMLCTATFELRRRGFEVTANKASKGFLPTDVNRWFPKAEVKRVDYKRKSAFDNKQFSAKVKSELESQGVGARGNLMIQWMSGGGHSMAYEVTKEGVKIFDGQCGKAYPVEKIINDRTWNACYARLDNVDFDPETIKECAS